MIYDLFLLFNFNQERYDEAKDDCMKGMIIFYKRFRMLILS